MTGIYSITNTKNGKRYIGSAREVEKRWSSHRVALRKGVHISGHLQASWKKYGEKSFKFEMIAYCEPEELIGLEQFYIDAYQSSCDSHGYNIRKNAANNLGVRYSAEIKAKISATTREAKRRPEIREKQSRISRGRKHRPESKAKVSAALRGRPVSAETRAKMSVSNHGHQLTSEQYAKMLASLSSKQNVKLNEDDVRRIRELLAAGLPQSKIAKMFGVSQARVCEINTGKAWGHVK
jgi:group I intron endonuclease